MVASKFLNPKNDVGGSEIKREKSTSVSLVDVESDKGIKLDD